MPFPGVYRKTWRRKSSRRRVGPSGVSTTVVTFDAASNSGYQTAQSTYTWNHTCAGSNRFLAVDVAILSVPGTTVLSITYAGVALYKIGAQSTVSGAGRVECWGLAAPTLGTNAIIVTLSASVGSAGTAVSYSGVQQTSPDEGFNSAQATNVGAADATVSVTTVADGDWVHGALATDDTAVTANQTTRNNVTGALGSGADEDTGPQTPAGAVTVSYTAVGALATWAIAGYGIRPATAASLIYSATSGLSVGPATLSGAATFVPPAYSGTCAVSVGPATLSAVSTFVSPGGTVPRRSRLRSKVLSPTYLRM